MHRIVASLLFFGAISLLAPQLAIAVTIPTVPVGNAGNGSDPSDGDPFTPGIQNFGGVAYDYRIGTTEVTNAQYAAFLNAKAASDPLGLYDTNMGSGFGGITQSGVSGSFSYAAVTGRGDMPVNWVSWYDSIRFANWLDNGQGSGDTETGSYTLLGGTPTPVNGLSITRNAGATWFLTSENEWYKAAYHKNDGVTSNYFAYPTSSDTVPTAEAPPGGSNSANYDLALVDLTDVGAYTGSDSPYGTFDQGGNVMEWNEALIGDEYVGVRGSSLSGDSSLMESSFRNHNTPISVNNNVGFRVASIPEPSTGVLAVLACGIICWLCPSRASGSNERKRFK